MTLVLTHYRSLQENMARIHQWFDEVRVVILYKLAIVNSTISLLILRGGWVIKSLSGFSYARAIAEKTSVPRSIESVLSRDPHQSFNRFLYVFTMYRNVAWLFPLLYKNDNITRVTVALKIVMNMMFPRSPKLLFTTHNYLSFNRALQNWVYNSKRFHFDSGIAAIMLLEIRFNPYPQGAAQWSHQNKRLWANPCGGIGVICDCIHWSVHRLAMVWVLCLRMHWYVRGINFWASEVISSYYGSTQTEEKYQSKTDHLDSSEPVWTNPINEHSDLWTCFIQLLQFSRC